MSRPTAMQRAQADARHVKALTTYAELGMAVDVLDGLVTREYARFGPDSEIADQLVKVGLALGRARSDAETRARNT